mmetsp:Transcript_40276/g.84586  ORF Transcript_40276/g.84586 Transcript_40276/m.84586 type:complete len:105 (+) Transcript_40276:307-621(+)
MESMSCENFNIHLFLAYIHTRALTVFLLGTILFVVWYDQDIDALHQGNETIEHTKTLCLIPNIQTIKMTKSKGRFSLVFRHVFSQYKTVPSLFGAQQRLKLLIC